MSESIEVRRNDEESRYVIEVDGEPAGFTEFRNRDGVLTMPHTQIDSAFEGRGLAKILVTGALDDIRERGEQIIAVCPYVQGFVEKNPQYADLVA